MTWLCLIIVFHQGDEGKSWYIILKGSINVVIRGKGTVTSLYEGDDFGKLALVNDAPRYVIRFYLLYPCDILILSLFKLLLITHSTRMYVHASRMNSIYAYDKAYDNYERPTSNQRQAFPSSSKIFLQFAL